MQVGGEEPFAAHTGDFLIIEREWRPGDVVKLSLPFPLTCQANDHVTALVRGPLVYAYFQGAQADPVVFRGHRGRFPEDSVLVIDPDQPGSSVQEEPVQDGLLGPALRVSGRMQARAPMFAASGANSELPGRQEQALLLFPFVNQGAIRGEYRVFMGYVRLAA